MLLKLNYSNIINNFFISRNEGPDNYLNKNASIKKTIKIFFT